MPYPLHLGCLPGTRLGDLQMVADCRICYVGLLNIGLQWDREPPIQVS